VLQIYNSDFQVLSTFKAVRYISILIHSQGFVSTSARIGLTLLESTLFIDDVCSSTLYIYMFQGHLIECRACHCANRSLANKRAAYVLDRVLLMVSSLLFGRTSYSLVAHFLPHVPCRFGCDMHTRLNTRFIKYGPLLPLHNYPHYSQQSNHPTLAPYRTVLRVSKACSTFYFTKHHLDRMVGPSTILSTIHTYCDH
jgi:hypothetical protein